MSRRRSRSSGLVAKVETVSHRPASDTVRYALVAALLALLVLTPGLYLYASGDIRNPDPFYYAQAARQTLAGKRLYAGVWPDKPPVLIWAYAVPQLVAPRSYRAVAFFGGCCVAATAGMYAWAFRRSPAAAAASALFLALFPLSYWDWAWPSSEMIANIFVGAILLVALAISRSGKSSTRQCVAMGILGCLAFHVRQNMVFSLLVPMFAIWHSPQTSIDKVRSLAAIGNGGLATWGIILAMIFATGDVPMYFWTVFEYPRLYAGLGPLHDNAGLSWLLGSGPLPWIVLVFAVLAASERRQRAFALAALAVGWGATVLPARNFAHYWASTFPYAALVIGLGTQRLAHMSTWKGWAVSAGLALVVVRGMCDYLAKFEPRALAAYENVAAVTDALAPQDGTLLVLGKMPCEAIQFASRLRPANVYEWMFQLIEPNHRILPTSLEEIRRQYLAAPPDVLVIEGGQHVCCDADFTPGDTREDVRLVQAILRRYSYQPAARLGDFEISLRVAK